MAGQCRGNDHATGEWCHRRTIQARPHHPAEGVHDHSPGEVPCSRPVTAHTMSPTCCATDTDYRSKSPNRAPPWCAARDSTPSTCPRSWAHGCWRFSGTAISGRSSRTHATRPGPSSSHRRSARPPPRPHRLRRPRPRQRATGDPADVGSRIRMALGPRTTTRLAPTTGRIRRLRRDRTTHRRHRAAEQPIRSQLRCGRRRHREDVNNPSRLDNSNSVTRASNDDQVPNSRSAHFFGVTTPPIITSVTLLCLEHHRNSDLRFL